MNVCGNTGPYKTENRYEDDIKENIRTLGSDDG